jgi:SSS family solute:Na+ symporter
LRVAGQRVDEALVEILRERRREHEQRGVGGAAGIAIALVAPTVNEALKFFYTLLTVSLFIPVMAGLFTRKTGVPEVLAAILGGVALTGAAQLGLTAHLGPAFTPAVLGLIASVAAWGLLSTLRPATR